MDSLIILIFTKNTQTMLELAGIIVLGILAQWVAWKLKIPAILPLILIGLFVGPVSTLITEDGSQWIQPIYNGKSGFFPDQNLFYFVSLAIGIILFEGQMTVVNSDNQVIDPYGSIGETFFSLFRITTGEDWTDLRYELLGRGKSDLVVNLYHVSWMWALRGILLR